MARLRVILSLFVFSMFLIENIESGALQYYDCWKPRGMKPCTVHSFDIDPCPVSKPHKGVPTSCEIVRGNVKNGTLKFSYTPEFNATKPLSLGYKAELLQDLPMIGMDTDACKYTKCPLVQGVPNEYIFPIDMKDEYPEGSFTVKWKIWNENEPIKEACCLKFNIELI